MKIDEFALADMENDEKKCEDYVRDGSNSRRNIPNLKDNEKDEEIYSKTCERCGNTFEYDEMDLFDGEWLCYQCEEEKTSKKQLKFMKRQG